MRRLGLCLLLAGCGGAKAPPPSLADDPADALPAYGEPALQLYLVLTRDGKAMQGKAAVDAMWAAVNGEGARYAPIRQRVKWVPGDYQVDVALDFADLPHPAFSAQKLAPMLADLPADAREAAEQATLAVVVRSGAQTLPRGDQIRLAGLAALYAADSSDGIILDLLARRAWTRDAWQQELAAERLGPDQVRLTSRADGAARWLLTRGNPRSSARPTCRCGAWRRRLCARPAAGS
ncbi:MAG: hypothetical protein R3F60_26700 [bacterium]